MPLPIVLRYVLVYAFETDRGPFIVDAGWNTDVAFDALGAGLSEAGFDIADVQGVMVTHIHPDHYGLAGRIREHVGRVDRAPPRRRGADPRPLRGARRTCSSGWAVGSAGSARRPARSKTCATRRCRRASSWSSPSPTCSSRTASSPTCPGWDLTAVWTPGHSPGHLCFWEPRNKLMLTGDCVLPRITPNVNLNPQTGDDPLGDYLRSLERLGTYDAEGLPAHEWRFPSLRDRTSELRGAPRAALPRSDRRRSATVTAPRGRSRRGWTWSRPWDDVDKFTRRSAIGEAMAHLRTLEVQGVVREIAGEPSRWELA